MRRGCLGTVAVGKEQPNRPPPGLFRSALTQTARGTVLAGLSLWILPAADPAGSRLLPHHLWGPFLHTRSSWLPLDNLLTSLQIQLSN